MNIWRKILIKSTLDVYIYIKKYMMTFMLRGHNFVMILVLVIISWNSCASIRLYVVCNLFGLIYFSQCIAAAASLHIRIIYIRSTAEWVAEYLSLWGLWDLWAWGWISTRWSLRLGAQIIVGYLQVESRASRTYNRRSGIKCDKCEQNLSQVHLANGSGGKSQSHTLYSNLKTNK